MRSRINVKNILLALCLTIPLTWLCIFWYVRNPIFSEGPLTTAEIGINAGTLEKHVRFLSELKPNRSFSHQASLKKAQDYIEENLRSLGYTTELQKVAADGKVYYNVIARYGDPKAKEIIVVGAHYDAAEVDNPGADDNASGVAALLELARVFKQQQPQLPHPVEFVAYTLEEPPFFGGKEMGSVYHADRLKERGAKVIYMLSLEMLGYYSDQFLSQSFNVPLLYFFYPWTGNFIGIVGTPADRGLQAEVKRAMAANSTVKVLSITAPASLPGVDYSDHASYWAHDWPAFMITDSAFLRNDQYHKSGDTADRLNYLKMAEVTRGIYAALLAVH